MSRLLHASFVLRSFGSLRQVATEFTAQYKVTRVEVRQLIVEDDRAVAECYWEDREEATGTTGKCIQAEDEILIYFLAGKISRWREYINVISSKCSATEVS